MDGNLDQRKREPYVEGHKRRNKRKNPENSGFKKPVEISEAISDFCGWDKKELKSRVDVTKFI